MQFNHELAEKQRDETLKYIERETQYCHFLNDPQNNPSIWERQLGSALTSTQLEARLRKLNPNFIFENHPLKSDKKCLYWNDSRGKQFICAYENGFMPEHSVFKVKEDEVWTGQSHFDKKDLPKGEFVPGRGMVWDSDVTPGFKKVYIPWGEKVRGWRTVLIKIIGQRLCTPTEVEKIFGSSNSAEWHKHLGKGQSTVPW